MVDTDNSVEVMFNYTYKQINHKLHRKLCPYDHLLCDFSNQSIKVRVIIILLMELGDGKYFITHEMDFVAVDCPFPYCVILG